MRTVLPMFDTLKDYLLAHLQMIEESGYGSREGVRHMMKCRIPVEAIRLSLT